MLFGFYYSVLEGAGGVREVVEGVDGSGVQGLGFALAGVLVEEEALVFLDLADSFVDAVLREQAMDLDGADLAHAVGSGDGLVFGAGFPLGFGEDDDRRRLDVEAYAAGFDLAEEYGVAGGGGESVDEALAFGGRYGAADRAGGGGDGLLGAVEDHGVIRCRPSAFSDPDQPCT